MAPLMPMWGLPALVEMLCELIGSKIVFDVDLRDVGKHLPAPWPSCPPQPPSLRSWPWVRGRWPAASHLLR